MNAETTTILLFAVAMAVALVARSLKVPYTVALVLGGISLGATRVLPAPHLTRELLYAVFLPGLIFEAAFHLTLEQLRRNQRLILTLAFPGVLLAVTLTTGLLVTLGAGWFRSGAPWSVPLVFAALITATDPIAVVGLFKSLGAPKRLGVIIEAESLVNDGTSVVVYTLAVLFATGGGVTFLHASLDFVKVVGLGLLIGATVGFAASKIIERIDDPLIEITLTTIAAYGSFAVAEQLHYSGIIATVTAGIICGSLGAPRGMRPSTRLAVESFWEYIAFALNSLVFLLMGLEVSLNSLVAYWEPIVVAFLIVTSARAVVVFVASAALRRTTERLPWRWGVVLTWGGLRGALSMVLALALPTDFPERELVISTTFGVVILSIIANGLTSGPLLRRLGLTAGESDREAYEAARGKLLASRAALAALDHLEADHAADTGVVEGLRQEYIARRSAAEQSLMRQRGEKDLLRDAEAHAARRHLLEVEKDQVQHAYRNGLIGEHVHEQLARDVDSRLIALNSTGDDGTEVPGGTR
ncbi:MAG: cation:proton antiporter [Polyangiaceae bacterium]